MYSCNKDFRIQNLKFANFMSNFEDLKCNVLSFNKIHLYVLKLRHYKKATKFEKNLPLVLMILSKNN